MMEAYDFYIEVIKITGPALVTGLTAYFVARFQFLNKKVELENLSEFKARELLYNDYEKRLQDIQNESSEFNKRFGQMCADPSLRTEVLNYFSDSIHDGYFKMYPSKRNLESDLKELEEAGISDEDSKKIVVGYNLIFKKLFDEPNIENLKLFIAEYNPYSILQMEILISKKEKLLVKYLEKGH